MRHETALHHLRIRQWHALPAVTVGKSHPYLGYFQFAKGLAEYRQGHFTEAADWMGKVLSKRGNKTLETEANAVLAMCQYRLHRPDVAHTSLAKAVQLQDTEFPKLESGDLGTGWIDWIVIPAPGGTIAVVTACGTKSRLHHDTDSLR